MKIKAIRGFFQEYRWLSNFWPCEVTVYGRTYPSAENAYQAMKLRWDKDRGQFLNISATEAKKLGQKIVVRKDWERRKLQFMAEILDAKFTQNPKLLENLLATGDAHLEEMNYWGDTFWGVAKGEGENHLGKLLMKLRDGLKDTA